MDSNRMTPDDLGDFRAMEKAFTQLARAGLALEESMVASNQRIAESIVRLRKQMDGFKQDIVSGTNAQMKAMAAGGIAKQAEEAIQAYRQQKDVLQQNTALIDQNTASVNQLRQYLSGLRKEYDNLDRAEAASLKRMQDIEQEVKGTIATLNELALVTQKAARTTKAAEGTYTALSKHVADLRNQLKNLPDAFDKSGNGINKLNKEAVDLARKIELGADALLKMDKTMSVWSRNVGNYPDLVNKATSSMGGLLTSFLSFQAIISVAQSVKAFGEEVLDITGRFEKYRAVLDNTLGSTEAGGKAFEMIKNFAAQTNFTVDELTDSYIKMANRGLRPGQAELMKIADVANATGKPFESLVEAINDVNNTERWNEIGIKAKTNGDKVQLTFKGVTKEVDRTEAGVLSAVTAFGDLNGVAGQTGAISQTLEGQMSNLGDDFDNLKVTVGDDLKSAFKDMIATGRELITAFIEIWKGTKPVRDSFTDMLPVFMQLGDSVGTLIRVLFGYDEKAKGTQIITDTITVAFKIAATIMLSTVGAVTTLIDAFSLLINSGKKVANFFGADFKLNADATLDNLVARFKKSAAAIDAVMEGPKNKPANPATGKPDTTPPKKTPPPKNDNGTSTGTATNGTGKSKEKELSDLEKMERKIRDIQTELENEVFQDAKAGRIIAVDPAKMAELEKLKAELKQVREAMDLINAGRVDAKGNVKPVIGNVDTLQSKGTTELGPTDKKGKAVKGDELVKLETERTKRLTDNLDEQISIIGKYTSERYEIERLYSGNLTDLQKADKESLLNTLTEIETAERQGNEKRVKALSDYYQKRKEKRQKDAEEEKELNKELANIAIEIGTTLVNGLFEIDKQRTQNRLTELDRQKEVELSAVGDSVEAKKAIEDRYDQEKKQVLRRQAIMEKAQALFSIAVNTAVNVSKALATPPLAVAIGILGGIQAAIVAARPLPQYRDGKNVDALDTYEGPALVGEAGRELWFGREGTTLVNKPSIVNVGKKDVILPNSLTEQLLRNDKAIVASGMIERNQRQHMAVEQIHQDRRQEQASAIAYAINLSIPSAEAIGREVAKANKTLPVSETHFDESGITRFIREGNNRRTVQEKKHRLR